MNEEVIKEIRLFLLSLFLVEETKSEKEYFQKLYMLSNHIVENYKIFYIRKRNGKVRTIYEPSKMLKFAQRRILDTILAEKKITPVATAYKKGNGIYANALPHVGKKKIVKLDIAHFFDRISFLDVYKCCFSYYPKSVGVLLTNLCCYADFLPQGAPTSPAISNLFMRDFDYEMDKYALEKGLVYTRYSDDMTFSGDIFDDKELIAFVKKKLKKKGLFLNREKTKVIYQNRALLVTGLVVNQKVNIKRSYLKKVRQEMYYINKYGIDSHIAKLSIQDKSFYLQSLRGRILYVFSITKKKEFAEYISLLDKIK